MSLKMQIASYKQFSREKDEAKAQRELARERLALMRERQKAARELKTLELRAERDALRKKVQTAKAARETSKPKSTRGTTAKSSARTFGHTAKSVGRWLLGSPTKKRAVRKTTARKVAVHKATTTATRKRKTTKAR